MKEVFTVLYYIATSLECIIIGTLSFQYQYSLIPDPDMISIDSINDELFCSNQSAVAKAGRSPQAQSCISIRVKMLSECFLMCAIGKGLTADGGPHSVMASCGCDVTAMCADVNSGLTNR